jgi:transcriptional regulator with XRE-family HTH domain
MPIETSQNRTLNRALKDCGGAEGLAKALRVSVESLSPWLTGRETPSAEIYIATLKLASGGPKKR